MKIEENRCGQWGMGRGELGVRFAAIVPIVTLVKFAATAISGPVAALPVSCERLPQVVAAGDSRR